MLKVSQLVKFISGLNPQNTPARLTFYNFIKHFLNPDDNLSSDQMNQFFAYCLEYPHWQQNKSQLGREVKFMLDNFNGFYQQKFSLENIKFPQDMQVLEIENFSDFTDTVQTYLRNQYSQGEKFRLVSDQNKRIIAIILNPDNSLVVRCFDKKMTIRHGQLEPLRSDLSLYYTANLELATDKTQRIEIAPYITAQFELRADQKCHGALMRGYVFQKYHEFKGEILSEQPKLFFPVKRLEQFFLDRRTDPFYQDLTSNLERTIHLIQIGDNSVSEWQDIVLEKAQSALDNIFIGDKMLGLLIRDLRHTAEQKGKGHAFTAARSKNTETLEECQKLSPLKEFDLTNSSPIVD